MLPHFHAHFSLSHANILLQRLFSIDFVHSTCKVLLNTKYTIFIDWRLAKREFHSKIGFVEIISLLLTDDFVLAFANFREKHDKAKERQRER